MRSCAKCGGVEFYASGGCKSCVRARSKARYEAKKPEVLAQMAEYQRRPEVLARRRAQYREENPVVQRVHGRSAEDTSARRTRTRRALCA